MLDDIVRVSATHGVLAVRTSRAATAAMVGHVERRARALDRHTVVGSPSVESGLRDVAARLAVTDLDPVQVARGLGESASARRALVIVVVDQPSAWDTAVLAALPAFSGSALFVLLLAGDTAPELAGATWFEVPSELDGASLARWWEAIAAEGARHAGGMLERLDAWRRAASRAHVAAAAAPRIDEPCLRWLARLDLAARAWPVDAASVLGEFDADVVLREGLVERRDGLFSLTPRADGLPLAVHKADALVPVAEGLVRTFPTDPWAFCRAADLVGSTDAPGARRYLRHALTLAMDPTVRVELWACWSRIDAPEPDPWRGAFEAAEVALALGDIDVALCHAEAAARLHPSFATTHVYGRALLARGDLVSARAAFSRASRLATDDEERAAVSTNLAEALYASGDLDAAEAAARGVLESTVGAETRLGARNVLGKLLLARAAWDVADVHFAEDACDAALGGHVVCEMRARVNRAIAILSRGNHDEARPMLMSVLEDAERRGELRAVGFALSNLAVLAIERHDYEDALDLIERTIGVRRRLGERLGYARDVTNLVELRLRLGRVAEAEEALRFGRHALGPGAPASRLAELALASARVHLARGRTLEAEREVRAALAAAAHSTDGEKLGESHRLAAMVAIEDGAIERARTALAGAAPNSKTPFALADLALVELMLAQAAGTADESLGARAVAAAREARDDELVRHALLTSAEVAWASGAAQQARALASQAAALRDERLSSLGARLAESFASRPDVARIASLERKLGLVGAAPDVEMDGPSPSSAVGRRGARAGHTEYVGRHPLVRALLQNVAKVGPTEATVLIHGESGTGKEIIAEALHVRSPRGRGPLVKVNCAALVETLLISELFGHEKGSFTGAAARKIGRFERANGGTLFLDEIGDISERTQVALLRVLEERTIERVGGTHPMAVDVRIVCATNRDLRTLVAQGRFREDLYYRLSGMTVEVPALRDRLGDLPLLCEHLGAAIAAERGERPKRLSAEALDLFARHGWPGNVRELDNALRAVTLFADGDVISVGDCTEHVEALRVLAAEPPSSFRDVEARHSEPPPVALRLVGPPGHGSTEEPVVGAAYRQIRGGLSLQELKKRVERECIAKALADTGGNITKAAVVLGMKRPRLSQLVKQYDLLADESEQG